MSGFFKRIEAAKQAFNASQQHRADADVAASSFSSLITLTREGLNATKPLARAQAVAEIKKIEETLIAMPVIGEDYLTTKAQYLGQSGYTGKNSAEYDFLSWMMLKYDGVARHIEADASKTIKAFVSGGKK